VLPRQQQDMIIKLIFKRSENNNNVCTNLSGSINSKILDCTLNFTALNENFILTILEKALYYIYIFI